jgi:AcrR family transcriptional regulator
MGRRGEHSREQIAAMALEAAEQLLDEAGAEALTTRAVARRIGYTAGSLYVVFRNRDDLILKLNARTLAALRTELDAAVAELSAPRQRLLALARGYLAFALRHPTRWRLVFEHDVAPELVPEGLRSQIDAFFDLICTELEALLGDTGAVQARRSAQALWGGVHGIAVLSITDRLAAGGPERPQGLVEDMVVNYLAGVGSRGPGG